jgi:hypothetical protein
VSVSKNKNNTPSLDLSFAYGTTIIKRLSEHDIRMFEAAEAAANDDVQADDPTIRTVTSLFTGKRGIKGLGDVATGRTFERQREEEEDAG